MALYRRAFQAMLKDPQFQAESARQHFGIDPQDDRQVETLLERAYAAPKRIRERAAVFAAELN
jgi:hypothetical protein